MSADVSVVLPGRNDGYGGNFLHRIRHSVRSHLELADRHEVDIEILIVEANPPTDRDKFVDAINWDEYPDSASVRIIEIPPEVHDNIANSDSPPLLEGLSKNVGVRRASGQFIATVNADIIFSDEMMQRFSTGALNEDRFYRANRHDLDEEIADDASIDEALTFARDHVSVIKANEANLPVDGEWSAIREHGTYLKRSLHIRSVQYRADPRAFLRDAGIIDADKYRSVYDLHYLVSGDFFLTSRDAWDQLMGHPEQETFWHMDSYTCIEAAAIGLDQVILEEPIYHQMHADSDHSSRPHTAWEEVIEDSIEMLSSENPDISNGYDWGLNEHDLPEVQVK